ncbi:MAG: hypothetical protein AB2693_13390 [Candidatus Thiodiazotropha sp.]
MANGVRLAQNAMQHDISCVIYFWHELKIALTGVGSRVRKPLAKQCVFNIFGFTFFMELIHSLVISAFPQLGNK